TTASPSPASTPCTCPTGSTLRGRPTVASSSGRIDVGAGAVYLGRALDRVNGLFTVEDHGVLRVVWPFEKLPHGLLVGATGGGKTSLLRVLIWNLITRPRPPILCLADGIPDADSFTMFRGQPGVAHVASGPDETARLVLALQRAGVKDADAGLPGSLKAQLKCRIAATGEAGLDGIEARLAFDDDAIAKRVPMRQGAGYVKAGGAEGAFKVPWLPDP